MMVIDFQLLENELLDSKSDYYLFKKIVNAPFEHKWQMVHLCLGIIVLLLVNKKAKTIDRVALSGTDLAEGTKRMSAKRFQDIKIPIGYKDNIIARAIMTGRAQRTTDFKDLFVPELTPQEARFNQAGGSIAYSAVFPFEARDGGALIYSYYCPADEMTNDHIDFMKKYTKVVNRTLGGQ
jgi:hypothetical protein